MTELVVLALTFRFLSKKMKGPVRSYYEDYVSRTQTDRGHDFTLDLDC
jgi:hypothetical protein